VIETNRITSLPGGRVRVAVGIPPDKKFGVLMVANKFLSLVDRVDKNRIVANLEQLAKYSEETNASGITRLAFSELDLKGKKFISGLMKEAGLQVHVSEIYFARHESFAFVFAKSCH
jgi:hypothetical protein